MLVAIDFGITNTDVVINEAEKNKFYTFPTKKINEDFIGNILDSIQLNTSKISNIVVTGGKSSDLKDSYNNIPITKINEIDAIGYGAIAFIILVTNLCSCKREPGLLAYIITTVNLLI